MDFEPSEFSGDVPTLAMVEKVRRMLSDTGADQQQVGSLDPVIMAVIIRLLQLSGKQNDRIKRLLQQIETCENDIRHLKGQRSAMQVALKKFQNDLDQVAVNVEDTASVQAAYENIFSTGIQRSNDGPTASEFQ